DAPEVQRRLLRPTYAVSDMKEGLEGTRYKSVPAFFDHLRPSQETEEGPHFPASRIWAPVVVVCGGSSLNPGLFLGFALQGCSVFEAIVAGQALHQGPAPPLVQHAADIFPGDARHRGEVALRDLLPNEDTALVDTPTERVGEA